MKILNEIRKKYGDGAAFLMGEQPIADCAVISTGSYKLDSALGVGGIPRGRIIEIYGPESSAKTTLCQHIIAEIQKQGGVAAFVDVEHALDPHWLGVCGVNIDDLIVSQPECGEEALDVTEMYVRSSEIDLVVVDSVAALVPRAEIQGEIGDAHMGLQARMMSQSMRRLPGAVQKSNCSVVFTNQLRQKIGVMFGNPETTTGGMALRFYASVRIDMRRGAAIKNKDEVMGNEIKATVRKNKVAPPFKIAKLELYYDEGISRLSEIIEFGLEYNILQKRGAFYSFGEERLAQGKVNLRKVLLERQDVIQKIGERINNV